MYIIGRGRYARAVYPRAVFGGGGGQIEEIIPGPGIDVTDGGGPITEVGLLLGADGDVLTMAAGAPVWAPPVSPIAASLPQVDRSTARVTTNSAAFTDVLRQNAGTALEIDLAPTWVDGAYLLASFSAAVIAVTVPVIGGNAFFRLKLETTSGTTFGPETEQTFNNSQFLSLSTLWATFGPLPAEALMRLRVEWRVAGGATVDIYETTPCHLVGTMFPQ